MNYVVVVSFKIRSDAVGSFRERLSRQAEDSLALEPDCHQFDICVDPAREGLFLLYERYSDEAAFQSHLQSDHFKAFDAEIAPWVEEKEVRLLVRL